MVAKLFEHPFDLGRRHFSTDSYGSNIHIVLIVKVRLQSQPTDQALKFTGPLDCFKQTYAKEGWRGLYRVIVLAENRCHSVDQF